jgi:transposase
MVAADARTAIAFTLSPGSSHDAPEGRILLQEIGTVKSGAYLLMDRAYEGDETRKVASELGYTPVVPPKSNRINPWEYDRELYRRRNEVERLFRRIKAFRRIFTRYDKLDIVFIGFILFVLIIDALK